MSTAVNPDLKQPKKRKGHPIRKTFAVIGTTLLSLFLVAVIIATIVLTALTVYIMNFMSDDVTIDLYNLDMNSTTFLYAYDKEGNEVEINQIHKDDYRIIVGFDEIPQHVKDAFVYTEDERFYEHTGVDFKRTFAAVLNEVKKLIFKKGDTFGGSTITQQLIKNVTKDDDADASRKIREIFRAMRVEDEYSKDEILEAYLNYIGMGGNTYGVQAAANRYFGKDISEVSIAEAASLAAIAKSTEYYRPDVDMEHLQHNKERRITVLKLMLGNGAISQAEYDEAVAEELIVVGLNDNKPEVPEENPDEEDEASDENTEEAAPSKKKVQSYFVDMVIDDVAEDFMGMYNISKEEAITKLKNGGYKVYTTMDIDMQNTVEQKFLDPKTFSDKELMNPPEAAFICMDYNGNIKAVVGGIGEKPAPMCLNRATMSLRHPGSCIKPISTYGYGMSVDLFHWSSVFIDEPIEIMDWEKGETRKWPKNYSNVWTGQGYFTFQALQRSLNTIPAQLCQQETPQMVYDFMQNKMGIKTLVLSRDIGDGIIKSDVDLSPMTVGALTDGITLENLVSAYQPFGNAGLLYEPTSYTKVVDSNGRVIIEHKYLSKQALDPDSAYVMNKLLQTVIEGPNGTGRAAKLPTKQLIGKTGTSQEWTDLSFVGCTPNYVSGIWYGYDDPYTKDENGKVIPNRANNKYYSSAQVWKNVFGNIAEKAPEAYFPENTNVKELNYCTLTGLIAGPSCPASADVGYYKPSNIPETCNGVHEAPEGGSTPPTTMAPAETPAPGETTPAPAETTAPPPVIIEDTWGNDSWWN